MTMKDKGITGLSQGLNENEEKYGLLASANTVLSHL